MGSLHDFDSHINGRRHRANMEREEQNLERIRARREREDHVAREGNKAFESLQMLNEYLAKLKQLPEDSLTRARAALKRVHVNIFDLVEQDDPKTHRSVAALAFYTRREKKIFPKERAKSQGLQEFLKVVAVYWERR
jgi:hypothetical protein